ncbi:MAG: hypothetical protein EBT09_10400 [Actinobacteria bacterium]|nr:hypothetical protein [Actinomycetota bacterium]
MVTCKGKWLTVASGELLRSWIVRHGKNDAPNGTPPWRPGDHRGVPRPATGPGVMDRWNQSPLQPRRGRIQSV